MRQFNFLILLLVLCGAAVFAAPNTQRIYFAQGTRSKTVTGYLDKKRSGRDYIVKVRAKQHLSLKVSSPTDHEGIITLVFVTEPNGAFSGEKSQRFDDVSTQAGDYSVHVAPNLMASNGESGRFLLKVWAK